MRLFIWYKEIKVKYPSVAFTVEPAVYCNSNGRILTAPNLSQHSKNKIKNKKLSQLPCIHHDYYFYTCLVFIYKVSCV